MKSEQVDPTCETVYHTVAHERTVSDGGGGGHGGRAVQHHRVDAGRAVVNGAGKLRHQVTALAEQNSRDVERGIAILPKGSLS